MIFFDFISWYYITIPKKIFRAWANFLRFNLEYFSVFLLLKTFFSHWRQYKWNYPRGFYAAKYLEVFFSNFISRILGATMRLILIIIAILVEIIIFIIGGLILIIWLTLPVLLIICLI